MAPRLRQTPPLREVDRAAWFDARAARRKLHKGQVRLVGLLLAKLGAASEGEGCSR